MISVTASGFFISDPSLAKILLKLTPDRYGKPYFFLYCLSDLVGYLGRCLMCQKGRAGELDPTLIDAEGLHFREYRR